MRRSAPPPSFLASRLIRPGWAALVIFLVGTLLYIRTFAVPMVGDDGGAIAENPTIRNLSDLKSILSPPVTGGLTVGGRPVLNLTLALNYAISGNEVWSYHVLNLVIHLAIAFLLFDSARRTMAFRPCEKGDDRATLWALGATLVWLVHPLQTESVTYIIQRAESLVTLFLVSTLYCFIRSVSPGAGWFWRPASLVVCVLGMATKEVMVVAPLVVLLFDRAFVSGSLREAWTRRRGYYGGLAGSWLVLAILVLGAKGRGGSAGFGTDVTVVDYLRTQCGALLHYGRLVIWPTPLVFDYGTATVKSWGAAIGPALLVLGFAGITLRALWRNSAAGFLGAAAFLIMAPSSSVVPIATQTMAEHRTYAASFAVLLLLLGGLSRMVGARALPVVWLALLPLSVITVQRNEVYRDAVRLWRVTVAQVPQNARAHFMLAHVLLQSGSAAEAIQEFKTSIQLLPDFVEARHDLGAALVRAGRVGEALDYFAKALEIHPTARTHYAYASALAQVQREREAYEQYSRALALDPDLAEAYNNRANLILNRGGVESALQDYRAALRLKPDYLEAKFNGIIALMQLGRKNEALAEAEDLAKRHPASPVVQWKLGDVQRELGHLEAAATSFSAAIRLNEAHLPSILGLSRLLLEKNQAAAALPVIERGLKAVPQSAELHHYAALAVDALGRKREAITYEEAALRLQPTYPEAAANLQRLRADGGLRRD